MVFQIALKWPHINSTIELRASLIQDSIKIIFNETHLNGIIITMKFFFKM